MKSKKHFLTFATNFKNENAYLKEWLDYHLSVGVDHFYLFDQDGGEEARELLRPYEERGQVTRHPWKMWDGTKYDGPTRFYQRNKNHMGYSYAAKHYRHEFQWLMKIDMDEFLFPMEGKLSVLDWLKTVDVKRVKGIKVPRINFGNNFHESKPEGPILRAYTRREKEPSNHKDIGNADFMTSNRFAYSSHWWHYKWYKFGKGLKDWDDLPLRVNHYYTKSLEEFLARQNVCQGRPEGVEGFHEKNEGCNEVEDLSMVKLLDQISN